MVQVPGRLPDIQVSKEPEHHDHYLPDNIWGDIVRGAQQCREESNESETDYAEEDFNDVEVDQDDDVSEED